MKTLRQQIIGYTLASVIALAVDMSLLWTLVTSFALSYLLAASLSFLAGTGVSYFFSVRLAFDEHRWKDRRSEFASFAALGLLGLVVNAVVIDVAIRFLALHVLQAKCVAAGFTFTCNFVTRRQLLFVRPPEGCQRDLSHD